MESGTVIELEPNELNLAALVGVRRHICALQGRRPDKHGLKPEDGWLVHIEGACGELAVAKYLGAYWKPTVNTFKSGHDVAGCQVRTRSKEDYDLLVRPDDKDEDIYVLVTGYAPRYRIRGWMRGKDAKQKRWVHAYGNRPPAYFIPADELNPPEDLKNHI
jgi:hypothetical protein